MVWDKGENPMSVSVMATIASSNLFCIIVYYYPLSFLSVFVFVTFVFLLLQISAILWLPKSPLTQSIRLEMKMP